MRRTLTSKKIPVLDIPGLGAFMLLHGNDSEMAMNGTRAVLLFNADDIFFELAARYNNNESVNVLDFVNAQRQLKARMYSTKRGMEGHK